MANTETPSTHMESDEIAPRNPAANRASAPETTLDSSPVMNFDVRSLLSTIATDNIPH
nr:hypothetical protein [Nocardia abscessus]